MLRSSPKTWNIENRDFYRLISLGTDQWIWWWCCNGDFNSGLVCLPCCLRKRPLKQDFSDIYLTTFLESVISEIQNLLESSFFSIYLKFLLDFEKEGKYWEKVLCFWDNCIWIGIVKLSLLRTGYFSSAANVLTSSPKNMHVNHRDFSNSMDLAVTNEYDKDGVMQISTVLGHVCHVACWRVLWNGTF